MFTLYLSGRRRQCLRRQQGEEKQSEGHQEMTATNVTAEQTICLFRSWKHEYQLIKSNFKTSLFDIYRCYNWLERTAGWLVWNVQKRSDSYTEISDIRFKFRLRSVAIVLRFERPFAIAGEYCHQYWGAVRTSKQVAWSWLLVLPNPKLKVRRIHRSIIANFF